MTNSFTQKLLLIFCLYLPFQLALNPTKGIDLASGRLFAIILFFFWLMEGLKNKKVILPPILPLLLIFSFLFFSFFSLFVADNFAWATRKLFFLLSFFPLYFAASGLLDNEEKAVKTIKFLLFGAIAASIIGAIQFSLQFILGLDSALTLWAKVIQLFLGANFSEAVFQNSSWLVNLSGKTIFRAIAFFPDPHMLAFYLGMLLPWPLAIYFKNKQKIYLLFFTLILIADFLTFSRGGYLGLFAGIIFAFFYFGKKIIFVREKKKIFILISLILILLFTVPNPVGKRIISSFDLREGSNIGRMETWKKSSEIIQANPWFGTGLGNYPLTVKPSAGYREPIYSHNLYLDIAAETGIINALIFIALIICAIISFLKKSQYDNFYFAGAVSLIIFSVHSLFETPLYSVHILPLFLIITALGSINVKRR